MNLTDLPHGQVTLDAAHTLAYVLSQQSDEEVRCIMVAQCLKVLASSVDHTDAYEPLTTCAADIECQAKKNIDYRDSPARIEDDKAAAKDARREAKHNTGAI